MGKIAIALLALIAVIAVTLLVLPRAISWNLFKPEIEAAVRKATGRDFEIGGDIAVSQPRDQRGGCCQLDLRPFNPS